MPKFIPDSVNIEVITFLSQLLNFWLTFGRTRSACREQILIMRSFSKRQTTHVPTFQLLLHSQPLGFGLIVELLTSGAELSAHVLADARDFASDAFEVLSLVH